MKEIWKPIEGFEHYHISNYGRVINSITGKLLKQQNNGKGYMHVTDVEVPEKYYGY